MSTKRPGTGKTCTVTLRLEDGCTAPTEAIVYGEWAAHSWQFMPAIESIVVLPFGPRALVDSHTGWRVTHVPTGASLSLLADDLLQADAERICKALSLALPEGFIGDVENYVEMVNRYHDLARGRRRGSVAVKRFFERYKDVARIIEAVTAEALST